MTARTCTKCKRTKQPDEFVSPLGKAYKQCQVCRTKYFPPKMKTNPISENSRNILLSERVDRLKLNYILVNHEKYLKDVEQKSKNGNIASKNGQLTLLTDYHNNMTESGELQVDYKQIKNFGRYYSEEKLSLQNLSKRIRHTICQEFTYDLDMVNAHPKLLSFYCHVHNIECEFLDYYINNREYCIEEIIKLSGKDRNEVKADILAILNGRLKYEGEHSNYPDWYKSYFNEVRDIITRVCEINPDLYNDAVKKRSYNAEGTCINAVMSNLENQALMCAYDYLVDGNIEVCALVYDGIMIYKNNITEDCISKLLKALSTQVKSIMGADIEWSMKKMDLGFDIEDEIEMFNKVVLKQPYGNYDTLFFDGGSTSYVNVVEVNETVQFVQDLDFKNGRCLAISSPLGSGKTSSICRYIDDNNIKRVLVLSPRISFAKSITNEYNERISAGNKFRCYDQINRTDLKAIDRLVISMESLHYLNYDGVPFDLLVVDECQANLTSHTCVQTNGRNIGVNFNIFESLLRNSKQMIFADAFFGSKTTQFLTDCQIPTTVYRYLRKMEKREAIIIEGNDLDCLFHEIVESIKRGERNYIFVSSANRATIWHKELEKRFPSKNFVCYTKGEGKTINDVRKEWGCLDAVLTTSTITVGINFDTPDYFHNVFIDVSSRAKNLVSDVFQSHYRVRHLINKRVYIHIFDSPIEVLATNQQNIMDELEWKESQLIKLSPLFSNAPLNIKRLYCCNILENNLCCCKLTEIVYLFLKFCNYDIIKKNEDLEDIVDEIDQIDTTVDYLPFDEIVLISKSQYSDFRQRLAQNVKLSDYEKMQIEKFKFVYIATGGLARDSNDNKADETFWKCWIAYKSCKINNIRTEKMLRNHSVKMEDLVRNETAYCDTAILSDGKNLQMSATMKMLDDLGINISQEPNQIIPHNKIAEFCNIVREKHVHIKKTFKIRDQRKNVNKKASLTDKECIEMLNCIFKKHGFTKIAKKRSITRNNLGKVVDKPDCDYLVEDHCDVKGLSSDEKVGLGIGLYNYILVPAPVVSKRPRSHRTVKVIKDGANPLD